MKSKFIAPAAFLAMAVLCLSGCGDETVGANSGSAVIVEMQQAGFGDLTLQNSFVGTILPKDSVYVIPFASGTVTEVNYDVGDRVNAGDVLFKIDDEAAQLQLKQAQLSYQNTSQQASMATGSQQTSMDLQLESSKLQVQSNYEQAQIQYSQLLSKYDETKKTVDDLQEQVDENQKKIDAYSSVSANDPEYYTLQSRQQLLEYQLGEAKSGLSQIEDSIPQVEAAYRAAEAAVKLSDDTQALTQGSVRDDTKAQLNTGLQLAKLGVDSAELALSYYTVTAPISGVITSRSVEVNSVAGSSSPAFVIADEEHMTVTFHVGENVKNTLEEGAKITVERGGREYNGHITEIGIAVNQQTGLFQVKADVEAKGSELPGGVSVKITADTYRTENAIVIPYDAVYYDNEGAYVYLCVDGKASKTRIETGIFDDESIAVAAGIKEGDILITSWSARLLDGVEVAAP